ncbi:hypothetical protein cypCar_00009460 [Cyprinus carpio]|nr:hypothetical protein cypCar_00009460 [Cyprinus carpio]
MSSAANGNDSKKFKGDIRSPCAPSRVIHVRKLPNDINEAEVISLGLPFGKVTNLLMLKGKNQAFLEMNTEEAAQTMVTYYSSVTPVIRNHPIFMQYSNHKELKTDNSPNQVIFSKFGTVLKVITFTKNNQFQALLQFVDGLTAQHAKLALDGQNIYNGCCTLRISFSKLTSLNVKYNNDKSRDYTRPDLPTGDSQPTIEHHALAAAFESLNILVFCSYSRDHLCLTIRRSARLPSSFCYPAGCRVDNTWGSRNLRLTGHSRHGLFSLSSNWLPFPAPLVILVSNLNPEVSSSQSLTDLETMSHLNGQKLYGRPLRITLSKHTTVQMPREGHEDQGLTKDYSNSPLHRFKKPGSKNYSNIFPPSSTLHLSNIPPLVVEDDLKMLFASNGALVKNFKFFQKDRKMALIQMGSVEEAIESLIQFHNHDLGENHHLRVSFSKSII